ncbi:MAG: hypothetical protein ACE5IL_09285 [Myxococcota bacterium]
MLRGALGLGVLYLFAGIALGLPKLADGVRLTHPLTWVGLGYAIYGMPEFVRLGLSRSWPAGYVRGATAGLFVVASLVDLSVTGTPNGGVLGFTYGLTLMALLGMLGTSFLVAAAVAAPG